MTAELEPAPVYNLAVSGCHEFYANGVLVHNCWPTEKDGRPLKEVPVDEHNHALDALRYVVAYVDKIGEKRLRGNRTAVGPPREHKGAVAPTAPPRGKQPRPLSDPRKDYRIT